MTSTRWFRFLIALDQAANVAMFNGMPDETISARAWREKNVGRIAFINSLFFWQENHCQASYEWEKQRKDLPADYQKMRAE